MLLADRARFPRDKPCGGGLTGRAVRHTPCAVDPVVEHVVDRFRIRLRYGRSFTRHHSEPLVLMTQRRLLDAYLADQAAAAGVDFRDGARVTAVEPCAYARQRAGRQGTLVRADTLVGADGANGIVARSVGLDAGIVNGVALEGNVAYGDLEPAHIQRHGCRRARRRARRVRRGSSRRATTRTSGSEGGGARALASEITSRGLRASTDSGWTRCATFGDTDLPMRRAGAVPARGRVLLVGDAAGLVDPLSGDGIYEAFVSARLAAEAILEGAPSSYPGRLGQCARSPRAHVLGRKAHSREGSDRVFLGRTVPWRVRCRRGAPGRRRAPSE